MGYYTTITDSEFAIRPGFDQDAYQSLCDLNLREDLKTGGTYIGGKKTESWFAWMPTDYPSVCDTWQSILTKLGFELIDNGDRSYYLCYDSKIGDEEHFFRALAPYVEHGSYICWRGEDGALYRWEFMDGKMIIRDGYVTWS